MKWKILASITILSLALVTLAAAWFTLKSRIPAHRETNPADKSLADFYQEGQRLAQTRITETKEQTVTFLAVGDISLSRSIANAIKLHGDPLYPYKGVEQLLTSTDFNFGNLESPFSSRDTFNPGPSLVFNAPKPNVAGLKKYNFAVLNLANNHAFDQGLDGVTTTGRVLDENGILHMGTGRSLDEAWQPAIVYKNGMRIGFIGASYASSNDGGKTTNKYVARIEDLDSLTDQISRLRPSADFIVVTMHAGQEYTSTANGAQVAFAHAAVDAGADIVIGAHPHWVQNVEEYKGKKIYYSLGNFIFDQSWSEQTKKGLALKITLSKNSLCHSDSKPGPRTLDTKPGPGTVQSACADDIQGTQISPAISIQEIPIYIKENCCPTENSSASK